MIHHRAGGEHHHDVGDEGCARIHEDAHEDGHCGKRYEIGRDVGMRNKCVCHQREGHIHETDEVGVAPFLEIVAAELDEERQQYDGPHQHIEDVASDASETLLHGECVVLLIVFQRRQYGIAPVVDNLTLVDDFLSGHHLTHVGHQHGEHFVALLLALGLVVGEVGLDEAVHGVFGYETRGVGTVIRGCCQSFVGGLAGKDVLCGAHSRNLSLVDAYVVGVVLLQTLVVGERHDTATVDFVQTLLEIVFQGDGRLKFRLHFTESLAESLNLGFRSLGIPLVIGLDEACETVALVGNLFLALEDGEGVLCKEGLAVPWFAEIEFIADETLARHERHQYGGGDDDTGHAIEIVFPLPLVLMVVPSHSNFLYVLCAKIQNFCDIDA